MRVRHAVSSIDSERSIRAWRSFGPMLGGATDATDQILPTISKATAQSIGVRRPEPKGDTEKGPASGARAHLLELFRRDQDLARFRADARADDAALFQEVHQPACSSETDLPL